MNIDAGKDDTMHLKSVDKHLVEEQYVEMQPANSRTKAFKKQEGYIEIAKSKHNEYKVSGSSDNSLDKDKYEEEKNESGNNESQNQEGDVCYNRLKKKWTEDEVVRVLKRSKECGTKWSLIAHEFPGRTENELKNKFYTTLRRVATRAQLEDPSKYDSSFIKCRNNLLQFVDAAIQYSCELSSKRGRKQRSEMRFAKQNAFVVPKLRQSEAKVKMEQPQSINSQQIYLPLEITPEVPFADKYPIYRFPIPNIQYLYVNLIGPYTLAPTKIQLL